MLQALLQGPFVVQLQQCLEGLPSDAVQQLVGLMQDLAERIGQHGQQVGAGFRSFVRVCLGHSCRGGMRLPWRMHCGLQVLCDMLLTSLLRVRTAVCLLFAVVCRCRRCCCCLLLMCWSTVWRVFASSRASLPRTA